MEKESKNDSTFEITDAVIVTEVVMHFSLMAATFPCLRKFLQAFDMHMGATTHMNTELHTANNSNTSGSYALKALGPSSRGAKSSVDHECNLQTAAAVSDDLRNSGPCSYSRGMSQTLRRFADMERRSIESDGSRRAMIWRTQK
jgi:hypothetical protein